MAEAAHRGKLALERSNYDEAIQEYTTALTSAPTSPDYLVKRATAYQRAKRYTDALDDANHAVLNAQKRAKREQIIEAQFRRGCALYSLERYGDAKFVLAIVKRMDEKHKMADMWINKTDMALAKLSEGDEKRTCVVQESPKIDELSKTAESTKSDTQTTGSQTRTEPSLATAPALPTPQPSQTPADKIRYDWYQNPQNIYFTLMAKGVPKDKAQIDISEHSLSISFPLLSGSSYDLTLEPLFAEVKPAECIWKVLPTKVEITLVKAAQGRKWSALESNEPVTAVTGAAAGAEPSDPDAVKRAVLADPKPTAPAYPTSSKSGPKDWDKITKDMRIADAEEAGKKSSADDDDYEGGDEANHFFQKLFKGATPEAQRAMMKSYQESNGTSLSTNWDEVSKGPVETLPPDGMEAKKW